MSAGNVRSLRNKAVTPNGAPNMLTQIKTERRPRGAPPDVPDVVVDYDVSSESSEPLVIAAERAGLQVSIADRAAASGPDWLGAL